MANDLWTTVEDAVVEALQKELESQVKTLATYQGDWLTDLHAEYWRFPAVLVQFRQSRGEDSPNAKDNLACLPFLTPRMVLGYR